MTHLKVYYSVQTENTNLMKLITIVKSLKNVKVRFEEYLEREEIYSQECFDKSEQRSYYYKNIMEAGGEYVEVLPINYAIQRELMKFL